MGDNKLTETLWIVATDLEVTGEELAAASRHLWRECGFDATREAARLAILAVSRMLAPTDAETVMVGEFRPPEAALAPIGGTALVGDTVAAALDVIQGVDRAVTMEVEDPFLRDQLLAIHQGRPGASVFVFTLLGGSALHELDDDDWQAVRIAFTETDPPATSTR